MLHLNRFGWQLSRASISFPAAPPFTPTRTIASPWLSSAASRSCFTCTLLIYISLYFVWSGCAQGHMHTFLEFFKGLRQRAWQDCPQRALDPVEHVQFPDEKLSRSYDPNNPVIPDEALPSAADRNSPPWANSDSSAAQLRVKRTASMAYGSFSLGW